MVSHPSLYVDRFATSIMSPVKDRKYPLLSVDIQLALDTATNAVMAFSIARHNIGLSGLTTELRKRLAPKRISERASFDTMLEAVVIANKIEHQLGLWVMVTDDAGAPPGILKTYHKIIHQDGVVRIVDQFLFPKHTAELKHNEHMVFR